MRRSVKHSVLLSLSSLSLFALLIMPAAPAAFGEDGGNNGGTTRLRAHNQAPINGIETELQGDFRVTLSPFRQRLDAELRNIHLPLNTPVAFCLVSSTGTTRLHVGRVHLEAGVKVAELDLDTNNGNVVPH